MQDPSKKQNLEGTAPLKRDGAGAQKISTGEGRLAAMLIAPTILLLGLVVGYPIVKAIYQSLLTDQGLDASGFFNQGNKWNGVTNYKYWILQQCPTQGGGTQSCAPGLLGSQFWSSVEITLFFAFVTVVLETIIGMGFALMMNRAFRGRGIVRAVILIPWAIPTAVTVTAVEGDLRPPRNLEPSARHALSMDLCSMAGAIRDHHRRHLENDAVHRFADPCRSARHSR